MKSGGEVADLNGVLYRYMCKQAAQNDGLVNKLQLVQMIHHNAPMGSAAACATAAVHEMTYDDNDKARRRDLEDVFADAHRLHVAAQAAVPHAVRFSRMALRAAKENNKYVLSCVVGARRRPHQKCAKTIDVHNTHCC